MNGKGTLTESRSLSTHSSRRRRRSIKYYLVFTCIALLVALQSPFALDGFLKATQAGSLQLVVDTVAPNDMDKNTNVERRTNGTNESWTLNVTKAENPLNQSEPSSTQGTQMAFEYPASALPLIRQQRAERVRANDQFFCGAPSRGGGTGNPASSLNSTRPSVAFLFLTGDKNNRNLFDDVWQAWFPPASDDRYSIWVHTQPPREEGGRIPVGPFFCKYAIPSVPSEYWFLHYAMVQLLKTAYESSKATHFIFVSSSSIPLQTFDRVYEMLTAKPKQSCFCTASEANATAAWVKIAETVHLPNRTQQKAELWSALSRHHARTVLNDAKLMSAWHDAMVKDFEKHGNSGAPDELFFATVLSLRNHTKDFSNLHGSLRPGVGTCCTHHVNWDIVRATDDPSRHVLTRKCAMFLGDPPKHPCAYKNVLMRGVKQLQLENYMFMRKVWNAATFETESGTSLTVMDGLKLLGVIS